MILSSLKLPPTESFVLISLASILKSDVAPVYPSKMVIGFPFRFSYLQIIGSSCNQIFDLSFTGSTVSLCSGNKFLS